MSAREYQPPNPIDISEVDPLIFLAGPIQGAPDWQRDAVSIFDGFFDETIDEVDVPWHVANPRRGGLDENFNYDVQVEWEKAGLKRAAQHGGVVFWFAARDFELEYDEDRSYAQTSRIEFGRVIGWKDERHSINISLGIESGYKGSEKYFAHTAKEHNLPVYTSLEDTCYDAYINVLPDQIL